MRSNHGLFFSTVAESLKLPLILEIKIKLLRGNFFAVQRTHICYQNNNSRNCQMISV